MTFCPDCRELQEQNPDAKCIVCDDKQDWYYDDTR